jgi:hypothetical protein
MLGLHAAMITKTETKVKTSCAASPVACRVGNRNPAYGHGMADRLPVYDLPPWWLAEFERTVAARGLSNQQLVEMLVPDKLAGSAREDAIKAARVTVTRFRKGRSDAGRVTEPQGTMDTILTFCRRLGLAPFIYLATSPAEAAALSFARRNPTALLQLAGQLLEAAQVKPPAPSGHTGGVNVDAAPRTNRGRAVRGTPDAAAEAAVRGIVERIGVPYVTGDDGRDDQTAALPSPINAGESVQASPAPRGAGKHQGPRSQRSRR